ncbi:MAG: hypothetical protein OSA89_16270 [Mariniblastus sp.]|nr:hypothetical protein [Mariniblastus sp.]
MLDLSDLAIAQGDFIARDSYQRYRPNTTYIPYPSQLVQSKPQIAARRSRLIPEIQERHSGRIR